MSTQFQITLDCADPQSLAAFWVKALGYKMEDPPAGHASWQDWLEANHVPPEQWNSRAGIVDPQGIGPRFWFQRVPESKAGKNRMHLDIRTGDASVSAQQRREKAETKARQLVEAGATRLYEMSEYGSYWLTLADPEGNEFCIG